MSVIKNMALIRELHVYGQVKAVGSKISKSKYGSIGSKIFLIKWGITIKFFKKFYLKSDSKYENILENPNKNFDYIFNLIICKLNFMYIKLFNKKINKILYKNR